MSQQFPIGASDAGQRLDRVLAAWLDLSRREVGRLLEGDRVRLNGQTLDRSEKGRPLQEDDQLEVLPFVREAEQRAIAEPTATLSVVSQGEGWLIVDKPAGAAVHPLRGEERGTLLNAVIARHPEIHGVGEGGLRSGVVHRLDLTTSGAVLFALNETQWQRLREAFRTHAIRKVYEALVYGRLEGEGRDTLPLVIRQHHPARVTVARGTEKQVRACSLRWRALETFANATRVEVMLETGFLHQIRVMLAHRGHAIVGDGVYGSGRQDEHELATRPMLHARSLTYDHVHGECPPPQDFREVLRAFRGGAEKHEA